MPQNRSTTPGNSLFRAAGRSATRRMLAGFTARTSPVDSDTFAKRESLKPSLTRMTHIHTRLSRFSELPLAKVIKRLQTERANTVKTKTGLPFYIQRFHKCL